LRELRTKKAEDPYAFYGQIEDSNAADDVSIAPSETSTKESFFTRYTGKTGGTAKTGASRRTAKNKRREERKKARGKKGTIYEEEYLVRSVGRLVERLEQTKPEAVRLIEGLIRRGMREQAYQIQTKFVELLAELKADAFEIYNISEKDRERIDENGEVYYIAEIPVPEIPDFPKKQTLNYSLSY
jgi:elongator complex protein 1